VTLWVLAGTAVWMQSLGEIWDASWRGRIRVGTGRGWGGQDFLATAEGGGSLSHRPGGGVQWDA
jgi:hypothetical protein